jgi:hypothetical protein
MNELVSIVNVQDRVSQIPFTQVLAKSLIMTELDQMHRWVGLAVYREFDLPSSSVGGIREILLIHHDARSNEESY